MWQILSKLVEASDLGMSLQILKTQGTGDLGLWLIFKKQVKSSRKKMVCVRGLGIWHILNKLVGGSGLGML